VVEASWLQTRLLGDRREDVCRYGVVSSADQITLVLPPGFATPVDEATGTATTGVTTTTGEDATGEDVTVEVRLNGQPLAGATRAAGRIVIDLPQRASNSAWLVELITSRKRDGWAFPFAGVTVLTLQPPEFATGTLQRRFYWELLLEPDVHPLGHPGSWTSQQTWEWGPFGLRRVPVISRDALRSWLTASCGSTQPADAAVGSATVATLPRLIVDLPAAGPRAVFSGVGVPETGRIWVVPTWLLVLAVSGPVFALGILGVYQPRLRSVPVVLGLAVIASLAAALFPDLAPLAAQAAVPGAALAALAAMLRFIVDRRTTAPPARLPVPAISASSVTQVAPQPSLIVTPSSPLPREGGTHAGRDLP
jgi:hypothetical protein